MDASLSDWNGYAAYNFIVGRPFNNGDGYNSIDHAVSVAVGGLTGPQWGCETYGDNFSNPPAPLGSNTKLYILVLPEYKSAIMKALSDRYPEVLGGFSECTQGCDVTPVPPTT